MSWRFVQNAEGSSGLGLCSKFPNQSQPVNSYLVPTDQTQLEV